MGVGNGRGDSGSNSWTRLFAFHIALLSSGKVCIQLVSLKPGQIKLFNFSLATVLGEGKLWIQTKEALFSSVKPLWELLLHYFSALQYLWMKILAIFIRVSLFVCFLSLFLSSFSYFFQCFVSPMSIYTPTFNSDHWMFTHLAVKYEKSFSCKLLS